MRYSLLRLLLIQREIPPMLPQMGKDHPEHSREEYLKEVFSKTFQFESRRSAYGYAYIGQEGSVLLGRVGKLKSETIDLGPDTGFAEINEDRWHAANFLLDVSDHEDGQKITFEEKISQVGTPLSVTRGMIEHINSENTEARWEINANTITETQTFWEAVDKYKGKITEMELSFVAPNLFGSRDKTTELLRDLKEKNNMQTTAVKLHNADGALNPDSEDVRGSLDLIGEGGGSAKLKTAGKTVYDSEKKAKKESVDDEENFPLGRKTKSRWRDLIERLFRL